MLASIALLAQLAIAVDAPDTVATDGVVELRVSVTSRGGRMPSLAAPPFRPFVVIRTSSAQRVQSGPGGASIVGEWRWSLAPTREGTFIISPFIARAGPESARSEPVRIVVRGSAGRARTPAIVERGGGAGDAVRFRALVAPDTVYVGQQATYQLGVFLDPTVRDRVRRMEAVAPDMRGVMSYEPTTPMEVYDARGPDGRRVEAHVYQRAIFPLAPGRIAIPPARLTYALPLSYSFFSREEGYEMRSDSVALVAIEPPREGRPREYGGAVGRLRVAAALDTTAARVGDPLTLRVRVSGEGNVRLWPRPALAIPWGSAVPSDEQVRIGSDQLEIGGTKEFEWLVTPQRAGELVLPAVRYGFWDPVARRYEVAQTEPETVRVAPGTLAAADGDTTRAARLPLRPTYRGALPEPVHHRALFWLALAVVPLPALGAGVARRRRARARRRSPAAELRRLARSGAEVDGRTVRRALAAALAHRLGAPDARHASRAEMGRMVRRAGAPAELQAELDALLESLERELYAADAHAPGLAARAWELLRRLDREMVPASPPAARPGAHALLVLAALAVLVPAAMALQPSAPAADFARGVASYERGEMGVAARLFERVAAREPRAPDAWANLGTAAWAAGDSARAAVGWQRALRLEPLATDARDRLALLGADRGPGRVLALPPAALAIAAALLWLAAWGWLALRLARGGAPPRPAGVGVVAALVLGAGALAQERALEGRGVAVVARGEALHISPVLGADATAALRAGEVARVVARDGDWARVRATEGREGWLPAAALLPLARE